MALRINCSSSLFLLPRAPGSSNSFDSTKFARLSQKEGEGGSWRDRGRWRCAIGLASLILAIEVGDMFVGGESQALESAPALVESRRVLKKMPRWSEKRKCDPWRSKSFEMIVPENLPRRSQRRKWEAISLLREVEINAPEIQVNNPDSKIGSSKNCFSL